MNSEPESSVVFTVPEADAGARLDAFLASRIEDWSRARLQRLIDDGDVLVNGRAAKASYKLRATDEIEAELTALPTTSFLPEDIPIDVVYEDKDLIVLNKPAGIVVHPRAGATNRDVGQRAGFSFSKPLDCRRCRAPGNRSSPGQRHVRIAGGSQDGTSAWKFG